MTSINSTSAEATIPESSHAQEQLAFEYTLRLWKLNGSWPSSERTSAFSLSSTGAQAASRTIVLGSYLVISDACTPHIVREDLNVG